jgi:hypothetical protein
VGCTMTDVFAFFCNVEGVRDGTPEGPLLFSASVRVLVNLFVLCFVSYELLQGGSAFNGGCRSLLGGRV